MTGEDSKMEKNVFWIGGNTFYDRKNKIPKKILESKRSEIGVIAEFCGIPNGFPNLGTWIVTVISVLCVIRHITE
jgi:hypothetical protein